jgi:hypothetical protein
MGKLLQTYESSHGLDTISGIINRYAPPSENPTPSYVAFVAGETGFKASEKISMQNQDTLIKIVQAMIRFEGSKSFSKKVIDSGIGRLFSEDA